MEEYSSVSIDSAMRAYKPLGHEKTILLARKSKSGDPIESSEAKRALIESQYGLCADVSRKWYNRWQSRMRHSGLDDVFQASVIGLMRAVDKYDPDSGFMLTTYSYRWMASFAQRFCFENSGSYRLPDNMYVGKGKSDDAINHACSALSIHSTIADDGDALSDRIEDHDAESHNHAIASADDAAFWESASYLCTDNEIRLMKMRVDGYTIKELSKEVGVAEHAVIGQVERGALKVLGLTAPLF